MNYSKWNEQLELVLGKLERSDNKEARQASSDMDCWAQNGCPNPEPNLEECESIYCHVMSNLGELGFADKPFYKDVYNIEHNI
tara:strand:- start:6735 stop:6983 length:249 start_codon:yes stop_codon:yes gene_type:complete